MFGFQCLKFLLLSSCYIESWVIMSFLLLSFCCSFCRVTAHRIRSQNSLKSKRRHIRRFKAGLGVLGYKKTWKTLERVCVPLWPLKWANNLFSLGSNPQTRVFDLFIPFLSSHLPLSGFSTLPDRGHVLSVPTHCVPTHWVSFSPVLSTGHLIRFTRISSGLFLFSSVHVLSLSVIESTGFILSSKSHQPGFENSQNTNRGEITLKPRSENERKTKKREKREREERKKEQKRKWEKRKKRK